MFDIGWQELFIVGILAIIVVGPKDLPRALRTVTQWIRKARDLAREFQSGIDEVVREADIEDIRKEAKELGGYDLGKSITDELDPDGKLTGDLTGDLTGNLGLDEHDTPETLTDDRDDDSDGDTSSETAKAPDSPNSPDTKAKDVADKADG